MASYDPVAALVTWLLTQATLTAETSTRIWGGGVPRSEQASMPRKCLSVHRTGAGMGPDRYAPDGVAYLSMRCYGATPVEATAVYDALYATVHRAHHKTVATGKLLMFMAIVSEPYDMIEPELEWPFVLVSMELRYSMALLP